MEKIVLVFSGGMDSTVLLYDLLAQKKQVLAVSFNYGQKHSKELQAASAIAEQCGITHEIIDISSLTKHLSNSSLTNHEIEVPDGHYASATMAITIVPNRNMIFLSIAAGIAINQGVYQLAYGAHGGDHFIYADCRGEFVNAITETFRLCDNMPVTLQAPYLKYSKADICKIGTQLGVPFESTWSCYKGNALHCGQCGTCIERREAFMMSGLIDPTIYSTEG
jgi:7-cyano-7-deazaguanine synthase